jgi:DNA-binding NarL/FixJ family response regulator
MVMDEAIRVLITDDHAMLRAGLVNVLGAESDINIVGEARDGLEAVEKAVELKPDVILMDIFMPRCNGLEAIVAIKERLPSAKILILTVSEREEDLFQALKLGAQGYLLKSATITEVVDAVRMVAVGEAALSPQITMRLATELWERAAEPTLSPREMEVLQLLSEGLTDTDIAERLFIGKRTVRTYLRRLLDKLHLKNRVEAATYAVRHHVKSIPFQAIH